MRLTIAGMDSDPAKLGKRKYGDSSDSSLSSTESKRQKPDPSGVSIGSGKADQNDLPALAFARNLPNQPPLRIDPNMMSHALLGGAPSLLGRAPPSLFGLNSYQHPALAPLMPPFGTTPLSFPVSSVASLLLQAKERQLTKILMTSMINNSTMSNASNSNTAQEEQPLPQQESLSAVAAKPAAATATSKSEEVTNDTVTTSIGGATARNEHDHRHESLAIDEDHNWLSEFHCFLRSDLIEVFLASASEANLRMRGRQVTCHQVGIRCVHCAGLDSSARASRSSAFPSSIRQIYQSVTMMVRDHFQHCKAIPAAKRALFAELKGVGAQGGSDSRQYWEYAARKLGMVDSKGGIKITPEGKANAAKITPYRGAVSLLTINQQQQPDEATSKQGKNAGAYCQPVASLSAAREQEGSTGEDELSCPPVNLVTPEDRFLTSDFLYMILSHVQVIHLTEPERVGKRMTLKVGLPGWACKYCCKAGWFGNSRMYVSRKGVLPSKVRLMYDHFRRCSLCPEDVKQFLKQLKENEKFVRRKVDVDKERYFFDLVWSKLGIESPNGDGEN